MHSHPPHVVHSISVKMSNPFNKVDQLLVKNL